MEDSLMTKKHIHDYCGDFPETKRRFIDFICSIQCTKDHTVIARTVEIFEKYSFTRGDNAVTALKGRKISWNKHSIHEYILNWQNANIRSYIVHTVCHDLVCIIDSYHLYIIMSMSLRSI